MSFHNCTIRTLLIAMSLAAPVVFTNNAMALGDACKDVNFSVDNDYDKGVTVTKVELYSESEGRWLSNNIPNIFVPKGAKDFVLYKGENIEYGENDRITQMKVHYQYDVLVDNGNGGGNDHYQHIYHCSTDKSIADQICVANRWYKGAIHSRPGDC
jgi:hypothetical protein